MLKLLQIDLVKLKNYRAFWVLNILYGLLIVSIPITVMEFLKWLKLQGADFDGFDPLKIPVLYFPDIWQNIAYVYTFLKIFLAIVVVISISNEYSYKTIRQNIIDGMSRIDFIKSKLATILLLSIGSTLLVFITGMLTGIIYTPNVEFAEMFTGIQFVFAYFLDLFTYLVLAFFLTILLKRSALTVFILLLFTPIEYAITANLPEALEFLIPYFPLHAINNLIAFPFKKYWFQEIQDYIAWEAVLVVVAYIVLYVYAIKTKLQKSDL
ncbi:hypothetical protein E1176_04000 [Fulvivirga sp. RKSG066]|uniref:ABC transporter permease n=1 Tax=Fulvivirga aurantia TaxID=2529383 RepID=UPI0012BCDBD6|nr:ABC transporter permease [Fulvivirga aurantia]MTI20173.1 hypothetical protein [Fulvivirga aurantia]